MKSTHRKKPLKGWGEGRFHWISKGIRSPRKAQVGGAVVVFFIFSAALAPWVSPYPPNTMYFDERKLAPSLKHPFGTDSFGRDVLSRVIWGARISLFVGVMSVGLGLAIGVTLGLISGYYGGKVDEIIMRSVEIAMSFPTMVLALILLAALGPGIDKLTVVMAISWVPSLTRLVRGDVLSEINKTYAEAAKAVGNSSLYIMTREILPNCLASILVVSTMRLGIAILWEAGLSFLGLGVQPPTPAWGYMLSEARGYMRQFPWMVMFPGLAIVTLVIGFNLLGDALRDALDPRLQTG